MADYIPTLADVCSAIAEGHLIASSDGATYQVNALELRRYFGKRRSLPTLSFLHALTSTPPDSHEYPYLDLCSYGR